MIKLELMIAGRLCVVHTDEGTARHLVNRAGAKWVADPLDTRRLDGRRADNKKITPVYPVHPVMEDKHND